MNTEVQLTVTAPGTAEQTADNINHSGPIVLTMISTHDIYDFEETENLCVMSRHIKHAIFTCVVVHLEMK